MHAALHETFLHVSAHIGKKDNDMVGCWLQGVQIKQQLVKLDT